jgi:o-succinylbenzoate synthase
MQVVLEGIELRRIHLPLAEAFRTGHGTRDHRDVIVVRALVAEGPSGWSECVAETEPSYWPEYTDSVLHVMQHHLVPRLLAGRPFSEVKGHQMAKAALETAMLDAGLRAEGRSVGDFLGTTRSSVRTGIALGIADDPEALADAAGWWRARGHTAFKLKVTPGWDLAAVKACGTGGRYGGDEFLVLIDAGPPPASSVNGCTRRAPSLPIKRSTP